jgi:hypothetical protein
MRILLCFFLFPILLFSAEDEQIGFSASVSPLHKFSLNSDLYTFPNVNKDDFDRGYIEANGALSIKVYSNADWSLLVKTPDRSMSANGGKTQKSLETILWRNHESGEYSAISNTDSLIVSKASPSNGKTFPLDFRILLDLEKDAPGEYELSLLFTMRSDLNNYIDTSVGSKRAKQHDHKQEFEQSETYTIKKTP